MVTAVTVNIVLIKYALPINFCGLDLMLAISLIRIACSPRSVKILKNERYAKTKLNFPNSTVPRYLARYIVTKMDIVLKITLPTTITPVFLATQRDVLN